MIKSLLFLCLSFAPLKLFPSAHDPYELAAFGGEPSSIVDGCVSAITGDYLISLNIFTIKRENMKKRGEQLMYLIASTI